MAPKHKLLGLLPLLVLLPASATEYLVVQSTTSAVPLGFLLNSGDVVRTADTDRVVLMRQDGQRTIFVGAGVVTLEEGPPLEQDSDLLRSLKGLVGPKPEDKDVPATTRSTSSAELESAQRSGVQIDEEGRYCIRDSHSAVLWRGFVEFEEDFSIAQATDKTATTVRWLAGETVQNWPSQLPLIDGGRYQATLSGTARVLTLETRVVPEGLPTPAHVVAWMADAGCTAQARRLLQDIVAR